MYTYIHTHTLVYVVVGHVTNTVHVEVRGQTCKTHFFPLYGSLRSNSSGQVGHRVPLSAKPPHSFVFRILCVGERGEGYSFVRCIWKPDRDQPQMLFLGSEGLSLGPGAC